MRFSQGVILCRQQGNPGRGDPGLRQGLSGLQMMLSSQAALLTARVADKPGLARKHGAYKNAAHLA
jgi:hypothetical protein